MKFHQKIFQKRLNYIKADLDENLTENFNNKYLVKEITHDMIEIK